jgi:hypothetical protein
MNDDKIFWRILKWKKRAIALKNPESGAEFPH